MLAKNFSGKELEAGCDEAGRGCLAGPVFAASVILPKRFNHPLLNDSKQLTEKERLLLRDVIIEKAVAYAVASVDHQEIDKINILNASILAMHRSLDNLTVQPEYLIIDGNRFKPYKEIPHSTIVKGDARFRSIAAASILAKTFRDDYMLAIHEEYPHYQWKKNKGYPTTDHRKAIMEYGLSPYHRLSFRQLKDQLEFNF
jgi:ribonuclease HII